MLEEKYYFDTSIWLDFLEKRDEPHMPKGEWATRLIHKIAQNNAQIVVSDVIKNEMVGLGYSKYEIEEIFSNLRKIITYVHSTEKQFKRARDLSKKRKIPLMDAFHALIARDNKAIFITLDKHFREITDIIKSFRPQDLI